MQYYFLPIYLTSFIFITIIYFSNLLSRHIFLSSNRVLNDNVLNDFLFLKGMYMYILKHFAVPCSDFGEHLVRVQSKRNLAHNALFSLIYYLTDG